MAKTVKDWIMDQRLQNYGYDWKDFQKMSSQKARLKKKIKGMQENEVKKALAKAGILGKGRRLEKTRPYKRVKGKLVRAKEMPSEWNYTTGQSFNEELLNIMKLSATKGKRGYW